MRDFLWIFLFLVIALGGGFAIGFVTRPDDWYARLRKAPFNPPNWVFAPVWTILYVLIAVAGWRVFARAPGGTAMGVWVAALALNFLWPPVFFRLHRPAAALVFVFALLLANILFIVTSWPVDQVAALLFVPYVAWVAFAALLNAAIVRLN